MYECSEHVRDFMHGEADTLVSALYQLRLILNEPVGPAIALSEPDIQVLNMYDMAFPAKGASRNQRIHILFIEIAKLLCQQA